MKKVLIFSGALFVLVFLALNASAAQIQFVNGNNGTFSQGETILALVTGNFINPLTSSNIVFYRNGHVPMPATTGVINVNGDFYIYGILGNYTYTNYTLSLENIKYMKGSQISQDNIRKNFTVSNATADFSIIPGAVSTNSNQGFSFKVQNLQDGQITLNINSPNGISSNDGSSINLRSGEIKTLSFSPTSSALNFEMINFTSGATQYSVPVLVSGAAAPLGSQTYSMGFAPSTVSISMATVSTTQRIIYLQNTGKTEIDNIVLNVSNILDPYITISPYKIGSLAPNETQKITISISSDVDQATVQGNVFAISDNASTSLTLLLDFVQNFIPANNSGNGNTSDTTNTTNSANIVTKCTDLRGTICGAGEVCGGNTTETADGACCLTTCQQSSTSSGTSSTSKWIGWTIVLIIFILVFWFFKSRYKKVRNKVDILKIGKK